MQEAGLAAGGGWKNKGSSSAGDGWNVDNISNGRKSKVNTYKTASPTSSGSSSDILSLSFTNADILNPNGGGDFPQLGLMSLECDPRMCSSADSVSYGGNSDFEVSGDESFSSYLYNRVISGGSNTDLYNFSGALVSSYSFGFINLDGVDENSTAFTTGQVTSLGLGVGGVVRAAYVPVMKGLSKYAAKTGSKSTAMAMSNFRNLSKWTNPTMWFSSANRAAHMIPAAERLAAAGSTAALAKKVAKTDPLTNAFVIPLAPFMGVFNTNRSGK
jgi:hypothetical protein